MDEHWVSRTQYPISEHPSLVTTCIITVQFLLLPSSIRPVDFSGGQITSDAGLLPLRAFDQRQHLTRDWAALLSEPREDQRLRHDSLALLRQRIYQIVAGYEDANDADRLRHDPTLQIVADQKLGVALAPSPRSVAGKTPLPPATWCARTICLRSVHPPIWKRSVSAARSC